MYDKATVECFLEKQLQLFPKKVAETYEEAEELLDELMATVVKGKKEVIEYFEEEGLDMSDGDILGASEVFDIGDGRYLIVEA